jgi:hypothetical protein
MKLPRDAIISERKLREYLLTPRNEDDKSGFLALAGYGPTFWRQLETDIRQLIHDLDAELVRKIPYGDIYKIMGRLIGPNGRALNIVTIWITLSTNGETRFVTLFPNKEIN